MGTSCNIPQATINTVSYTHLGEIPGRKDKHKMGPMQMKLLNEIEKSMRLKENGMNIASVVTLQEACVEAARDVNEYISPLCDATVHITIGVLRYVADLLEEEGGG